MKHGIISTGKYDIFRAYELSYSFQNDLDDNNEVKNAWAEKLAPRGFHTETNVDFLREIFRIVCDSFAEQYGERFNLNLREGYLTKAHSHESVRHNDEHRIYSNSRGVYVDLLMSSVLYDYAVTYYVWARYEGRSDIAAECFNQTLYNYDGCCRKGKFSGVDGSCHMIDLLGDNLQDQEIVFAADLYWCMLAFALCHEVAHIYLKHCDIQNDKEVCEADIRQQEYDADKAGYDIYLRLIMKYMHNTSDEISSIFQEYMYTAPMILLLFYHGLFYVDELLYDERRLETHPDEEDRINKLLEISQSEGYDIDTVEGNILLSNYYLVSDAFCEKLKTKLQEGKLDELIRKDSLI